MTDEDFLHEWALLEAEYAQQLALRKELEAIGSQVAAISERVTKAIAAADLAALNDLQDQLAALGKRLDRTNAEGELVN